MGSRFAQEASRYLTEEYDTFFGFTSASLETLQQASRLGLRTILDQIDPAVTEWQIVAEEECKFRRLTSPAPVLPERYFQRIAQEWETASAVVVNSNWSKQALRLQGVPESKIFVAPLGFEPVGSGTVRMPWRGALRVLWLGTLCLRKGLPYAFEAAERLIRAPVRFTFVGPCALPLPNFRLPPNAQHAGAVARSEAARLYREHDVFIFPTLSDGFGLTQVEALAYGLPVIATRNCGEVVENGKSGFLIEARDPRGLADAILRFVDEPDLLPKMSRNAIKRSRDFQTDAVWPHYARAITGQTACSL